MLIRPFVLLLSCVGALAIDAVNKDLIVTNADRTIDLASQLVKINSKLTISNSGQSAIKSFHFTVDDELVDKLVFIGATVIIFL